MQIIKRGVGFILGMMLLNGCLSSIRTDFQLKVTAENGTSSLKTPTESIPINNFSLVDTSTLAGQVVDFENTTFHWNSTNNADHLLFQVATDSNLQNIVYERYLDPNTTQFQFPSGFSLNSGSYYWTVQASNQSGIKPPTNHSLKFFSDVITEIDQSFGSNGMIGIYFPTTTYLKQLIFQSDGSYLGAGYQYRYYPATYGPYVPSYSIYKPIVTHILSDGSLDSSFGINGIAYLPAFMENGLHNNNNNTFHDVAVQPDGKIIAVGSYQQTLSESPEYRPKIALLIARFLPNGNIDTSFATGGIYLQENIAGFMFIDKHQDVGRKIMIDPMGNIYVSGSTTFKETPPTCGYSWCHPTYNDTGFVLKLKNNGMLAPNFGVPAGTHLASTSTNTTSANVGVMFYHDGSLYIGETVNSNNSTVKKFLSDGSLDTSFGTNGTLTLSSNYIREIKIQKIGQTEKLIFVGDSRWNDDVWVKRFSMSGQPDTTFGTFHMDSNLNIYYDDIYTNKVIIQKNGKILIAVHLIYEESDSSEALVVRLTADGKKLDHSFFSIGYLRYHETGGSDGYIQAKNIKIDDSFRIYLLLNDSSNNNIMRLH